MTIKKNIKNIKKFNFNQKISVLCKKNANFYKNALKIKDIDERIDDLQLDGLVVLQRNKGYCFTSDSVLLANYVKCKNQSNLLELCAGCGVISILISHKNSIKKIDAIELQKSLFNLCLKNFKINNLDSKSNVFNDNLKNAFKYIKKNCYDVVVCNPPYEKIGTSLPKLGEEIQIARSEMYLEFSDIVFCAKNALKYGGSFYFISKAERFEYIVKLLNTEGLTMKNVQFIYEKPNTNAKLFLCKATKGGKSGCVVNEPLFRCDCDGKESEQIKKIYNRNKEGKNG